MVHENKQPEASDMHALGEKSEKSTIKARAEAGNDLGLIGEKVKQQRQQQYDSGNSGITGKGDKNGKFRSAKDILGDHAHKPLTKDAEMKRDAAFRNKHGNPDELQGGSTKTPNDNGPMDLARGAIQPISDLCSKAASWDGPKKAVDYMMQVTGVTPEAHKEQHHKNLSQNIGDALTELGSAFASAVKTIDQIGQQMHPRAIVKDSHETAEAARKSLQNAGEYLGDKVGKNDLGSIVTDVGGLFSEGWGELSKAVENRNKMTPIERGHLPGAVSALVATGKIGEISHGEKLGPVNDAFHMPEVPKHLKHLELQKATPELLDAMVRKGRTVDIAETGSAQAKALEATAAKASYTYTIDGKHIITLPPNAPKIAALEEYLHATQKKLGILDRAEHPTMPEVEVKDFMIRHSRMLGLTENDVQVLETLKRQELKKLERAGYQLKD